MFKDYGRKVANTGKPRTKAKRGVKATNARAVKSRVCPFNEWMPGQGPDLPQLPRDRYECVIYDLWAAANLACDMQQLSDADLRKQHEKIQEHNRSAPASERWSSVDDRHRSLVRGRELAAAFLSLMSTAELRFAELALLEGKV
jgi:hypothetical protein